MFVFAFGQVVPGLLARVPAEAESFSGHGSAVLISQATYADPGWRAAADALVAKHDAQLVCHQGTVETCRRPLRALAAVYVAFAIRPQESDRAFVVAVDRLTRALDGDPCGDALGLMWDRDTIAFYGDPAWDARVERVREPAWDHGLEQAGERMLFRVRTNCAERWSPPPGVVLPFR